jgi:hypothetical protein
MKNCTDQSKTLANDLIQQAGSLLRMYSMLDRSKVFESKELNHIIPLVDFDLCMRIDTVFHHFIE